MGRTTTEIEVGTEQELKVEKAINFLKSQGYEVKDYEGYEAWVRPCPSVWGDLIGKYYCIHVQPMGDKWVIDEWVTDRVYHELTVNSITAILGTWGMCISCHRKFNDFIKNM